jgi:2-(1,2-epoxy-1,2-dihydrophenyl)acetyl-CoA isomerase
MKMVERAATGLHRLTKPTVAAVDGVAVGAGMNLALGCDVVIASERARFSEIFVRRGLTVDFGGTWLLPRIVGLQRAKELALSGRIIPAAEAVELGIAMEVVPVDELRRRADEIARSFLAGAPIGQMFAKQGLNASFESSWAESLSWEGQSQAIAFRTEDVVEGVAAFLQKRDPDWTGK